MKEFFDNLGKLFSPVASFFGILGGWLCSLLGGWDIMLETLCVFVILDYISGVVCAAVKKSLSSRVGFKGIIKKLGIFAMVVFANYLERLINGILPLREIMIAFFLANEGISFGENWALIGLPMPERFKELLIQLRDGANKGNAVASSLAIRDGKEKQEGENDGKDSTGTGK